MKSYRTQTEYRKRMMEIWAEAVKINISQRHADQAWWILNKGWLVDIAYEKYVNK